jgi:hypothetical protein
MEETMKIERIDYYNLDRSVRRNNDFLENLRNLEVDMSMVHRYSAHDVRDFSGVADFHAAAKRDHPNFKFSDALGKKSGTLGYMWSVRSVLSIVKESGQISIVCQDDAHITRPIADYNALLDKIPDDDFKYLQIGNCENNAIHQPRTIPHMRNQEKIHPEIWKNFRAAGDNLFIISPAGAKMSIQAMDEKPNMNFEGVVEQVLLPRNIPGCYAVVHQHDYYELRDRGQSDMQDINAYSAKQQNIAQDS